MTLLGGTGREMQHTSDHSKFFVNNEHPYNMNHYCDYVNYNHQVLILHIPGILKYMGAHAGETGLRNYQVARMVHQKFKDK